MGLFNNIQTDPPIEVFHLTELFIQDANPSKVNLGVGVYQDENGKTLTLPVCRSVEQQMAQDLTLTKNYLKDENINFVPYDRNPTNSPQCRPIEDFFGYLSSIVYANN